MQPSAATGSPLRQRWTTLSLLQWATSYLVEHGFDEARLHVELLLASVLSCSRLQLYTHFDRPVTVDELARFKTLLKRRLAREPLQYILGETEFMGIRLAVDRRVLIPRPETELLVEQALLRMKALEGPYLHVLDIGTGSGNIAIAVAKFDARAKVVALDVSAEALQLAESNARSNGIATIEFCCANIFDDVLPGRTFDLIISNPPYISRDAFSLLQPEVRDYEPRIATTDGADGLTIIRRVTEVAARSLRPGGFVFLEIAYDQSTEAREIAERAGLHDIQIAADFAGHPRILSARK